jgi:hypothetical protein
MVRWNHIRSRHSCIFTYPAEVGRQVFCGIRQSQSSTPNVVGAEQQPLHPFSNRQTSKPNFILLISNILANSSILLNMLINHPRAREVQFVQFAKNLKVKEPAPIKPSRCSPSSAAPWKSSQFQDILNCFAKSIWSIRHAESLPNGWCSSWRRARTGHYPRLPFSAVLLNRDL